MLQNIKPFGLSGFAPGKVHFTERVSGCIYREQPPPSWKCSKCSKRRWKTTCHTPLAATMHASRTTFRCTGARIFAQGIFFFFCTNF